MSDKTALIIELTPEQHRQIEERAHQRGYNTPEVYLLALVENDLIEDDLDEAALIEGFRESWHQAMTGDTRPVSELRDALNEE